MTGRVVSIKMKNTAVVLIESKKTHPLYKKSFAWSKKYLADDPIGVKLGDIVEIIKIRPISKLKHWQVAKILGQDLVALGEEHLKEEAREAIAEVIPEEEPENSEDSENQNTSDSANHNSDISDVSDKSDTPSDSESSESSKKKPTKRTKKEKK